MESTPGRIEFVEMESRLTLEGSRGLPAALANHGVLLCVIILRAARWADELRRLWIVLLPYDITPPEDMELTATRMRTRDEEVPLVAFVVSHLDTTEPLHSRRGCDYDFPIPEVVGSLDSQGERVTFRSSRCRIAVKFVSQDNSDWTGCERCRTVRTSHRDMTSGEYLMENCVAGVLGLRVSHLVGQPLGITNHRSQAVFAP